MNEFKPHYNGTKPPPVVKIVYPTGSGGQFLAYAISKGLKDNVASYRCVPHQQGWNRWKYVPEWQETEPQEGIYRGSGKIRITASVENNHEPWKAKIYNEDYIISITPKTPGEMFWCLVNNRMKNLYDQDASVQKKKTQTERREWVLSEFIYSPHETSKKVLRHDACPDYAEYLQRIQEVKVDREFSYNTWHQPDWQDEFITKLGNDLNVPISKTEFRNTIEIWRRAQVPLLNMIVDDIKMFKKEK